MGTTGLIYVAIVAAWAAYLVPMWLRRHDEQSRDHSVERYSSALRVLSRRAEGGRSSYVVKRDDGRVIAPESNRTAATLRARRIAAMRRRRVLSVLTLSLLSVGVLAGFAMLPVWTPAIPGGLIVVFLVLSRMQVRKQQPLVVRRADRPVRKAARADASYAYGSPTPSAEPVAAADAEPTVEVAVETPAEEPAAEGLWDPVPVTLPIYVYKEKAPPRTVRTISLPGTDFATPVDPAAAGTPAPPAPPVVEEPEEELDEHIQIARAVGD